MGQQRPTPFFQMRAVRFGAALLAVTCVGAGPSCPSSALSSQTFDLANVCTSPSEPARLGPGLLDGSTYDIAAFYFGHQY